MDYNRYLDEALQAAEEETMNLPHSGRIPLPRYHVFRTKSELQMEHEREAAKVRNETMLYRILNGTRDKMKSFRPAEPEDESLAAMLQQGHAKPLAITRSRSPQRLATVSNKSSMTSSPFLPDHVDLSEDNAWSITGFDDVFDYSEVSPNELEHPTSTTVYEDEEPAEQVEIFDFDL